MGRELAKTKQKRWHRKLRKTKQKIREEKNQVYSVNEPNFWKRFRGNPDISRYVFCDKSEARILGLRSRSETFLKGLEGLEGVGRVQDANELLDLAIFKLPCLAPFQLDAWLRVLKSSQSNKLKHIETSKW